MVPSSSPSSAIAITSSLDTLSPFSPFASHFDRSSSNKTKGYITTINTWTAIVAGIKILFQYIAPIVFGIISEKTKIDRVSIPDIIATQLFPNSTSVIAPTPAAPTVFAMVFKLSIADNGRLIFSLNEDNFFPIVGRSFEIRLI